MNATLRLFIRIYNLLLHLYPHSYQEEFAEEMLLDFSDMATDAGKKGFQPLIFFCLRELVDFPVNLLKMHLEKKSMNPAFHPGAARNILRIAFAFGLALALNIFGGVVAFTEQFYLGTIYYFKAVHGTDMELALLNFSNLILGPILAATILLIIFPEMRPIKRYLPVNVLVFALPTALSDLRLIILENSSSSFIFGDTIFSIGYLILIGLGFGVLASLISRERRKTLWLLLVGSLGYFLINWASAFLIFSLRTSQRPFASFWHGLLSVAMRNTLMGIALGLLLGVVLEFKRRDNTPDCLPSQQMDSL